LSVTSQDLIIGGQRLNLLLLRDVTAAHDRQQQLETFAGTVAHDLKTPLSALTGWMEAAAEEFVGDDTDTGLMLLHRAQAAVFRMQKLIDDYLAFAVSRGGAMTVVDVPLAAIVSDVVAGYDARGLAAASGPYFAVDVPHVVRADEALTRQLVGNLVGNAVKYARPGRPAHIDIRSAEVEPGWIEVAVADRGRGLDPGDEERIFTAFSRSTKDAADVEGIGLGLSLCHAIVTRHGGRIGAATNTWGGATFRFTLPAGTAP
jgi:signal transduction histidine kinase